VDIVCPESAMTRAAVGIALLLSGSLTLAAQSASGAGAFRIVKPGQETPVPTQAASVSECPVSMHASQDVWSHTIAVQKGLNERFGQRISLTLRDSHASHIVAATVRVQGLTGKNHVVQIQTGTAQSGDSGKKLKVTFAEQSDGSVSGDLWIGGFTSITSIQLLEASYADGSTWRISGSNTCSVKPDPLMLVSNR
jgi:hypothetical protein